MARTKQTARLASRTRLVSLWRGSRHPAFLDPRNWRRNPPASCPAAVLAVIRAVKESISLAEILTVNASVPDIESVSDAGLVPATVSLSEILSRAMVRSELEDAANLALNGAPAPAPALGDGAARP